MDNLKFAISRGEKNRVCNIEAKVVSPNKKFSKKVEYPIYIKANAKSDFDKLSEALNANKIALLNALGDINDLRYINPYTLVPFNANTDSLGYGVSLEHEINDNDPQNRITDCFQADGTIIRPKFGTPSDGATGTIIITASLNGQSLSTSIPIGVHSITEEEVLNAPQASETSIRKLFVTSNGISVIDNQTIIFKSTVLYGKTSDVLITAVDRAKVAWSVVRDPSNSITITTDETGNYVLQASNKSFSDAASLTGAQLYRSAGTTPKYIIPNIKVQAVVTYPGVDDSRTYTFDCFVGSSALTVNELTSTYLIDNVYGTGSYTLGEGASPVNYDLYKSSATQTPISIQVSDNFNINVENAKAVYIDSKEISTALFAYDEVGRPDYVGDIVVKRGETEITGEDYIRLQPWGSKTAIQFLDLDSLFDGETTITLSVILKGIVVSPIGVDANNENGMASIKTGTDTAKAVFIVTRASEEE